MSAPVTDLPLSQPEMVSLETAAARLGVSTATAYRLRREGKFPLRVVQIGSQFRVYAADLEELVTGKAS